jgi:DNA-binding beta-propeller fold protein YncE
VIKRIKLGAKVQPILVVPDSSRAYVGVNGESTVAIIDLKTMELTGRIPIGAKLGHSVEEPGFPNGTGAADMAWLETK